MVEIVTRTERSNVTYQCFNETYGWVTICYDYDTFRWTVSGTELLGTYVEYNGKNNSIILRDVYISDRWFTGGGTCKIEFPVVNESYEYMLYQRRLDPCDRD